jgi:flagellar biosynthesis protein FlhB
MGKMWEKYKAIYPVIACIIVPFFIARAAYYFIMAATLEDSTAMTGAIISYFISLAIAIVIVYFIYNMLCNIQNDSSL